VLGVVMVRLVLFWPPDVRERFGGVRRTESVLGPEGETEVVRLTVPAKLLRLVRVTIVEESDVPLKTVREATDVAIA